MANFRPCQKLFGLMALSLGLAVSPLALAQDQAEKKRELSSAIGQLLEKLKPQETLKDEKTHDATLQQIDAALAKADPKSWDSAVLNLIRSQILLQRNPPTGAIPALESAVNTGLLEDKQRIEFLYILSQLYATKPDYVRAKAYAKQWLEATPTPTADGLYLYAVLTFQIAADQKPGPDGKKPTVDADGIKEALNYIDRALHTTLKPKADFYVLKIACLQLLGEFEKGADVLELLVKQYPDKKDYWTQLAGFYLQIQDPIEKDRGAIRSILTYERAQARGFLSSPEDNFNLVGIYYNLGQYDKAAELLESGLKDGKIKAEKKNYELLAFAYQQMRQELKAIEVLKFAAKKFNDGQMFYVLAQLYYGVDQAAAALDTALIAAETPGLSRPDQTWLFIGSIAIELRRLEVADRAVEKLTQMPGREAEAKRIKDYADQLRPPPAAPQPSPAPAAQKA